MNRLRTTGMLWPLVLAPIAALATEPAKSVPLEPAERARCLEILRAGFKSGEFWPSMHAAEALTLAGENAEVVAALKDRLPTEKDDQRRCGLARELVRAGDQTALPVLFAILVDTMSNGRVHAAESLYKIGQVGDGKALRAAFDQTENVQLRLMAAGALAKSGQQQPLDFLRAQLKSSDRLVRNTVAFVLARLGVASDYRPLFAALQREMDEEARAVLVNALASLGDAAARDTLRTNLDSPNDMIRAFAAEAVGYARCFEYRPILLGLLDDPALDVRIRAAQSLVALSLPAAKEAKP